MHFNKETIKGALGLVVIVAIMYAGIKLFGIERARTLVENAGVWAPIVFILIKASTIVIAPLNGTFLYIISAPLFGFGLGLVYSWIGDLVGAVIAFWLARRFGQRVVHSLLSPKLIKLLDSVLYYVENWKRLAFARLIFSSITEVVSYGAGLSKIAFTQYVVVTAVWEFISVIPYVFIGDMVQDSPVWLTISLAVGAPVIGILGLAYLRKAEQRRKRVNDAV